VPSNEGRGYVLRRLLRRAALFSRQLGPDKPFLTEVVRATIAHMGQAYPETVTRQDFILRLIGDEEARFRRTLNTGLELLDGIMEILAAKGEKEIPGENLFKLADTYGFPVELTREIASGRGFSVDMAGFEQEMTRQRQRARASHKFEATVRGEIELKGQLVVAATPFIGYDNLEGETSIISIVTGDRFIDTVHEGETAGLILEVTPFYGEMGGQVGDTGRIIGPGGEFVVTDTIHLSTEVVLHKGYVGRGLLAKGDKVSARVDRERRFDITRNHTATHLLHSALRQVLGEHVEQRGSLVSPERLRFDFSHLGALTREEIKKIQQQVNSEIRQNLLVSGEDMHYKKAITAGAIALFGEKYGDTVRVITVSEPAVSTELCGGTHVTATGEIGSFQIVSESSIGAGLRRIEGVTGREAEVFVEHQVDNLERLASLLKVSPAEVSSAVSRLLDEKDAEYRKRQALERELSLRIAESLLAKTEKVNDVNVLAETVPASRLEVLREMSDWLRDRLKNAVIVLGTVQADKPVFLAAVSEDLVTKGYHAGEIVKQVARVAGGGGGGKATLAQAGGKHKEKLAEALGLVKKLVESGSR
jgi:alanyl-tRNA synthetase